MRSLMFSLFPLVSRIVLNSFSVIRVIHTMSLSRMSLRVSNTRLTWLVSIGGEEWVFIESVKQGIHPAPD
jgi:hypothetical protein